MTWMKKLMTGAMLLSVAAVSQAALQARDLNGDTVTDAYYDTELNITWLRDWNAGAGSSWDNGGSTTDGRMTWDNAKAWAENLSFGGYTDWRLPTMVDKVATAGDPPDGCNFGYSGTDCGYNVQTKTGSTVYSEMAHLYYVTLGSEGYCNTTGSVCGGSNGWTFDPQADYAAANGGTHPFQNMQWDVYWSGLEYVSPSSGLAWVFFFDFGYQGYPSRNGEFYAVAVRPGDVAASVPEPQALALMLLGLTAVGVARRRRPR